MNSNDLYKKVCSLPNSYENRDLEEYLLALYALVEKHQEREMTDELFIELFSQAFISESAIFREDWLLYENPPHNNGLYRKFTNPTIKDCLPKPNTAKPNAAGVNFTLEVLRFQISELHKMRDKQLKNESRYFGIDSETGHRWYNFDPFTILECGVSCMIDNSENEDEDIAINWATLGELLEDGRIYE